MYFKFFFLILPHVHMHVVAEITGSANICNEIVNMYFNPDIKFLSNKAVRN